MIMPRNVMKMRGEKSEQDTETARRRFYRGHRSDSFYPEDLNELLELRARQRTFDGAYARGALSDLGYALTILRLFDDRFARIGLVYCILAALLFVIAYFRHRQSRHDFADKHQGRTWEHAKPTVGQSGKRVFGRPFITAGWTVVSVTIVVALVEIALVVLILTMDLSVLSSEAGFGATNSTDAIMSTAR
ncbi:uncharacterized protein LAESUDRAFT_704843 [Laetiporus sulphureus 93-53]|uniref:DUF202 domain-containing protein n=1 Tax=Laetiporus sulphureus 93-53 TaxID=1314785 RepID=A0A165CQW0_9APHY|nr:uncharacterized protein LAESUDRAFT_704843 [Laetiporus sulphureus 93-53]KZT03258.1 hypothetical protein LAESUDRAFT_704843 [Laetiporus sulphureus 93-53]